MPNTLLEDFWWGVGGSPSDIRPDAAVLKTDIEVTELCAVGGSQYNATFARNYGTVYSQKLFGFAEPRTNLDGFSIGRGDGWRGPTRS